MSWSSTYVMMFYLILNGDSHWTTKQSAEYINDNKLHHALVRACHDLEIIDKREEDSLITPYPDQLEQQIEIMRERWKELAWQPYISDTYRFPSEEWLNQQKFFNRDTYNSYEKQAAFYTEHYKNENQWYTDALQAIDNSYNIYDVASKAMCEHYYVTTRRKWLIELKGMMGTDAYMSGRLPPAIPLEYLKRID